MGKLASGPVPTVTHDLKVVRVTFDESQFQQLLSEYRREGWALVSATEARQPPDFETANGYLLFFQK